jgi:acyl-CoA thioesterase
VSFEFDDATAVASDGSVSLPERWTMGPGFAHGGYLMSVALAAAMEDAHHPDPVTTSAHFVRPGKVGSAKVTTSLIKAGRTLSTIRADLHQDDQVCVATITTFGDLSTADDIAYRSIEPPDLPPPDSCVAADPAKVPSIPRMVGNLDLRLTPASTSWASGHPHGPAMMEGWVSFRDERPIDALSLPMFADALPQPVLNVGVVALWTPTIELTVHVRRRPTTQRLGVSFHTQLLAGTYFESSGTLWNEDGTLVAMSRQIQLINR